MMKLPSSDQECQQLEDAFKTTTDQRLRARCRAILTAHRGRRHRYIAEDLGLSVRTLQRWLRASQAKCLAGLKILRVPGWTPRIPAALSPAILT